MATTVSGEALEKGIQKSFLLAKDEAIVLQATEAFIDTSNPGTYKEHIHCTSK